MSTTLTSGDYTAYKSLSQFETVAEMNEAIRAFLYSHRHELPTSAVTVLKMISRYACKLPGVAFMKVATIASKVDLSDRTVRRALKTLEQTGIIERKTTMRRQGGHGHNVYVITHVRTELSGRGHTAKPRQICDQAAEKQAETMSHETKYSGLNNSERDKRNKDAIIFDLPKLPKPFVSAVRPFSAVIDINEAWRKVTLAHRQAAIEADVNEDSIVYTAVDAFKAAVRAYKANRIHNDIGGYFYGCLRNVFAVERRREVAESGDVFFNWVAENGDIYRY